jgi:hypothetical protein
VGIYNQHPDWIPVCTGMTLLAFWSELKIRKNAKIKKIEKIRKIEKLKI